MPETIPPPSDKDEQARRRVGAYAKLLANYASDDAIIEAGEAAELLFVRGLAFCATSDADGFITDAQVTRYVGAGMRDAEKRAKTLAKVGVWERLDGGYLVRSWTKIHPTSAEKGRRRKADRERKRKPEGASDSTQASEPIPSGIRDEGAADSLSMTEQCSDTTEHDTTEQSSRPLREQRNETLRAVPASKLSPKTEPQLPSDARCTAHRGVVEPGPCPGCKAAREKAERVADRAADLALREAQKRAADCEDCDGYYVVDADRNRTRQRCDHRKAS